MCVACLSGQRNVYTASGICSFREFGKSGFGFCCFHRPTRETSIPSMNSSRLATNCPTHVCVHVYVNSLERDLGHDMFNLNCIELYLNQLAPKESHTRSRLPCRHHRCSLQTPPQHVPYQLPPPQTAPIIPHPSPGTS